jgi:hypothetical protein
MLGWFVRISLALASVVTGWFVAQDAPNFGVVNVFVAIVLLTAAIAVLAFWPMVWAWLKDIYRDRGSSR